MDDSIKDGGGRKARLVELARAIVEGEGQEALTLRKVAAAAGVSHMAPYRHFDGKDALLAAVAESGFRDLAAALDGTGTSATRRDMGLAYVDFARRHPALYRLMFGPALPDKARFPGLHRASAAAFDRCVGAVGGPAAEDVATRARAVALWALVHGLASLLIDGRVKLPRAKGESERDAVARMLDGADAP